MCGEIAVFNQYMQIITLISICVKHPLLRAHIVLGVCLTEMIVLLVGHLLHCDLLVQFDVELHEEESLLLVMLASQIPTCAMRLKPPTYCVHCGAKKFQYETPGFCCSNGEVKVPKPDIPKELSDLFGGRDAESLNFQKYVRLYNNMFAFSSLGGDFPCIRSRGIYTFRAHGHIYHYLSSLIPADQTPRYLQLYFYDAEHEPDNRSVAGILLDSTTSTDTDGPYIVVTGKSSSSHRIIHFFGCYDPLQYPLLFPRGEPGWRQGMNRLKRTQRHQTPAFANPVLTANTIEELLQDEEMLATGGVSRKTRHISCREFYCYLLQIREGNSLLDAGRLLQQYSVDMYVKLENTRLDFFRDHQDSVRADLYQGIIDTTETGEDSASNVGHRVILPPTFIGGPRDMKRRYLNAMTLVQRYGKPDLFLTITCNPNGPEIKEELANGQQSQNRLDLLARIFRARLIHLKKLIVEKHIFGEVAA